MSGRAEAGGGRPLLVALRALGLGDVLTCLPALRALAGAFPGHRRVLAGPPGPGELAVAAGAVDEVLPAEPLAPLAGLPGPVDVAVNLHGRGPQSHRVLRALRPRRLVAFGTAGVAGPAWRPGEHEVLRWCRLLEECGIPADPARLDLDPAALPPCREAPGATIVHPGAAHAARRWPAERWAAVARAEADRGRRVLVTGGRHEVGLARRVAGRAGLAPDAVRAGETDVAGLAALVATAGRVACGDTGVAHLATALGRPSVVLFGPVPPSEWGPPPDRPHHVALWAGRRGDPRGERVDPGLLDIGVAQVVAALRGLPDRPPVPLAVG
ncbi:MAG: glycosyltransferase family 9 protein [Acidimicrobiia bacterium]